MKRTTVARAALLSIVVMGLGCTSSPALLSFGGYCAGDTECASGMCDHAERFCTQACSASAACPRAASAGYVCGASGVCERACSEGSTQGSGATRTLCVSGAYVACSTLDAMTNCALCGCEPFGGGMCLTGRGCVVPRADGQTCTIDEECSSHACYRDTHVCGAPRPMGGPCSVDAECATHNCSADGDPTVMGHCNQMLGSECTPFGMTATCTDCDRWDSILPAVCARAHCGPGAACPQLGDPRRVWSCEMSTDGTHHCFEQCTTPYNCFDTGRTCRSSGFCG